MFHCLSSFPNMLHNQLVYSFYSAGKLTIRMIHMLIVVKPDTQARYVKFSSQLPLLPFPQTLTFPNILHDQLFCIYS